MNDRITARWYFDVVSPYACLHLQRFHELHPALAVEPVPVLFAGLLKHWGSDTIPWVNASVDDPRMFDSGEMQRAAQIEVGASRKEAR